MKNILLIVGSGAVAASLILNMFVGVSVINVTDVLSQVIQSRTDTVQLPKTARFLSDNKNTEQITFLKNRIVATIPGIKEISVNVNEKRTGVQCQIYFDSCMQAVGEGFHGCMEGALLTVSVDDDNICAGSYQSGVAACTIQFYSCLNNNGIFTETQTIDHIKKTVDWLTLDRWTIDDLYEAGYDPTLFN